MQDNESSSQPPALVLPKDHPQRAELNEEIHARPPEPLTAPCRVSYIALFADDAAREQDMGPVTALCGKFGIAPPKQGSNHFQADFGPFRLKWERHTEFSRYTFVVDGVSDDDPFSSPAINAVPAEWVSALPGQLMVSAHAVVLDGADHPGDADTIAERFFGGNPLIGAHVAGGLATAVTDFQIQPDGFIHFMLWDHGQTPRQTGRSIQRLLEIDTYRIMALLTLPVARALNPIVSKWEQEVAEITEAMVTSKEEDEPQLLDRLTRLQAGIESRYADSHFRFSAAEAYYALVQRRIVDLREDRMPAVALYSTFIERRLAPAMSTCASIAKRQDELSRRVARATQLLSTRVDIARRKQNQDVLESLNRRAALQLRLQETVEGLSIAAVTYYVVGIVTYGAKGLKSAGVPVNVDLVSGISIPIVILLAALTVRKIRNMVTKRK